MVRLLLIGLGAGAAAALLFAAMLSGSSLTVVLVSLAPLPVMLAAIGWSHWLGLVAVIVGASGLLGALGTLFAIAFLIGAGLPGWWLGYLTLLARDRGNGLEWYPVGSLLFWTALVGSTIMASVILLGFGTDIAAFQSAMRGAIEQFARLAHLFPENGPSDAEAADWEWRLTLLVAALPPTIAIFLTLTNATNLWLGARILRVSGRLRRPWPDLTAMALPRYVPGILALALACVFLQGLPGTLAAILTASLLMAYGIVGFAVVHALTRRIHARGIVLTAIYTAVFLFTWPMLVLSLLALLDAAIDLRGRVALGGPPPHLPT